MVWGVYMADECIGCEVISFVGQCAFEHADLAAERADHGLSTAVLERRLELMMIWLHWHGYQHKLRRWQAQAH